VEQTSWILFLKYLDDLEKERAKVQQNFPGENSWSVSAKDWVGKYYFMYELEKYLKMIQKIE
jgi:hypothetical protein